MTKLRPPTRLVIGLLALGCVMAVPAAVQARTIAHQAHGAAVARSIQAADVSAASMTRFAQQSRGLIPNDNWWQCAPGNVGFFCDGSDPIQSGCSGTQHPYYNPPKPPDTSVQYWKSVQWTTEDGLWWQIQVWRSNWCGTVWARLAGGSSGCHECILTISRNGNPSDSTQVGDAQGGDLYSGAWTNQLYLPCGSEYSIDVTVYQQFYGDILYNISPFTC